MGFSFQIHGLRELDRKLKQLDATVAKKEARAAVRAGAAVVRKQAVTNARAAFKRRTGELLRAFRVSAKRRGGAFTARVFLSRKRAFYGLFQLRGWMHTGRTPKRSAKTFTPIQGRPVLTDALRQSAARAVEAIRLRLAQAVKTVR